MRTEREEAEFATLIEALAAQFGVEPTPALATGYEMGLDDLPMGAIKRAVGRAIRECQRMPRAVELRALAGEMSNDQRAVIAWESVRKAMSRYGSYASVDFDDPLVNATVRNLGGWTKFGETSTEEFEKWLRKDFERVYGALARTGVSAEAAAPLLGQHAVTNGANGYEIDAPKRVLTGLPPHSSPVVRELSAPERLVLAGPQPEREHPLDVAARLAEQKAVS